MNSYARLEQKCENLVRNHKKLAQGYQVNVRRNGLIIVEPNREDARMLFRLAGLMIFGLFIFKAIMMEMISPQTYLERIYSLQSGTFFERIAAWLMQPEPVSEGIVAMIKWMSAI
ncbi:MAG: hypothetical protein AB8B58_00280 [Roseobacter sp.]